MNSISDILPLSGQASRRRVILRADAGSRIGFGHYVRTVALAAYLSDDFEVLVATRNPDLGHPSDYQRELAEKAGVTMFDIQGSERQEFDMRFISKLRPGDIVVLDNYYYSTEYQEDVRRACHALVCIDDMHDRHFVSDLLMTFCPLEATDFSIEPYTRFRGGIEWSFLRAPFLSESKERKTGKVNRVVIAMGGADPFRITDRMVAITRKVIPDSEIDVIAGQTVEISFQSDEKTHIWRQADAETIVRLFDDADLGIFPASTVCVEAFSRRLPVAAGHYVDNQEEFYARGVEQGWFAPLGCLLDEETEIESRLSEILSTGVTPPPPFDFRGRRQDIINLFKSL